MNEVFTIVLIIVGLGSAAFLFDRLGLWMEDRGWIYYRKKKPKGVSGMGNALHDLHSFFEQDMHKADEEIVVRQHKQSPSSDPFDPDAMDEPKTE